MSLRKIITVNWGILLKKTILCLAGTAFVALGVTIFLHSKLGSDPISVWIDGLSVLLGMSFGDASIINNTMILVIALMIARRYIKVGTIIGALLTGPFINLFEPYMLVLFTSNPSFRLRLAMIITGQLILCFGIALNLCARFGFGPTDSIISTIRDKIGWEYRYLKIIFDATFTIGGILLGGVFGVGTILGVIIGGPIISEIGTVLDRTLIRWMGLTDHGNEVFIAAR